MDDKYLKRIEAIDTIIYELIQKEDERSKDYDKMLITELTLYDLRDKFERLLGRKIPNTFTEES